MKLKDKSQTGRKYLQNIFDFKNLVSNIYKELLKLNKKMKNLIKNGQRSEQIIYLGRCADRKFKTLCHDIRELTNQNNKITTINLSGMITFQNN